ncbi:MAG: 4Fe-4S binding protein [Aminivibrio sp.]|jgi:epoxyqueuosine reductase
MEKNEVMGFIEDYRQTSGWNRVSAEKALRADLAGLEMFDSAIGGVAAADDPGFLGLKDPDIVGPHHLLPGEWLEGARSVFSFFLPFSPLVRKSNIGGDDPSCEWLHARIEGQDFINRLCRALVEWLEEKGWRAISPAVDPKFAFCYRENSVFMDEQGLPYPVTFTSNWSERHAAFICGLGTFGLSKGFITEKGMAGRFGSVITEAPLEPDNVIPDDIWGNCHRCGKCALLCPVDAISLEKGKDHALCSDYVRLMGRKYSPRYGCGKCQTGVPCEFEIPAKD